MQKSAALLKISIKFIMLLACLGHGLAWSAAAQIQLVIGDATVWERNGSQRPAQKGVQLYPGDAVVTAASSNVQIRMTDDTLLWVHPNSRLKIDKYTYDKKGDGKDNIALQLVQGAARTATGLIAKANKENVILSTSTATIGIRGTDFETAYVAPAMGGAKPVAAPGTYNRVYSGATVMKSPAGQVEVNEGEAAYVGIKPGDKPQILKEIPEFLRKLENPLANNNAAPSGNQETIALRYRSAEEIIPLLKPLLGGDAVLTGQGSRLVLAAPDNRRANIKAAITSFDIPLRKLQVTVRFDDPKSADDQAVVSSRSRGNEPIEQRIQVQEGQRAFFHLTQSQVPKNMAVMARGVLLVQNPQPGGEAGSGIEVLPRVVGNNVSMEFYAQRTMVSGVVNKNQQTQRIGGTVSARLGEWVEAGGNVLGSAAAARSNTTLDLRNAERTIYMRVDEIE
jgi:hypothetical protein